MASIRDHISVCICTYKRPKMLARLLNELQNQTTGQLFTYSIVVVDNDHTQSARSIVASFKGKSLVDIDYYNEPEKNFSLVRNKSIKNARGNFVAFIDDDEFPVNDWLLNLYKTLLKYKADGVLGPVKPHFEKEPPEWIIRGKFCERPSPETGTILNSNGCRTGNVLLRYNIFEDAGNMFDPEFGTGSEDSWFFMNLIQKGHVFVSCKEAPVYESVPSERMKKTYFLRRSLLNGANSLKYHKGKPFIIVSFTVIKSISAFLIYTFSLPFLYFLGGHICLKILVKDCDHIGRLIAFFGINITQERNL